MTNAEFLTWQEFYKLFPFDDRHRYYRPAALMSHSMSGAKIDELLDFLQPDARNAGLTGADLAMMRALGFNAKGQ